MGSDQRGGRRMKLDPSADEQRIAAVALIHKLSMSHEEVDAATGRLMKQIYEPFCIWVESEQARGCGREAILTGAARTFGALSGSLTMAIVDAPARQAAVLALFINLLERVALSGSMEPINDNPPSRKEGSP